MKIAILGASRGLGAALVQHIHLESPESVLILFSRDLEKLKSLGSQLDWIQPADLSKTEDQKKIIQALKEFMPNIVYYVAGGGPFGRYEEKDWKDHAWAFEVNFLFPAKLIHELLSEQCFKPDLRKIIVVGSAIAGQKPDPKASSYAASKHAIRGLVHSIQQENPVVEVELFEPGYMDTSMLPQNAWPRQQGLVRNPNEEARKLWQLGQI